MNQSTNSLRALPTPVKLLVLAGLLLAVLGSGKILSLPGQPYGVLVAVLASVAFMMTTASFAYLAWRFVSTDPIRTPMRRYQRRLVLTMTIYGIVLVLSVILYQRGWGSGAFGYALAAAPALPIIGVFVVLGRYLKEETDDFARTVVTQAYLLAAAFTFGEATFWGFLESFGKVAHLPLYVVSIAFFVQIGPATLLISRRFR